MTRPLIPDAAAKFEDLKAGDSRTRAPRSCSLRTFLWWRWSAQLFEYLEQQRRSIVYIDALFPQSGRAMSDILLPGDHSSVRTRHRHSAGTRLFVRDRRPGRTRSYWRLITLHPANTILDPVIASIRRRLSNQDVNKAAAKRRMPTSKPPRNRQRLPGGDEPKKQQDSMEW